MGLVRFDLRCDKDGLARFQRLKNILKSRLSLKETGTLPCGVEYRFPSDELYTIILKTDGLWFGYNDPPVD